MLTDMEQRLAVECGCRRQLESLRMGSPDGHGFRGDGWGIHIEGAAAELAVAKLLGLYWPASVGSYHDADLEHDIQVRLRREHKYELIVRPDDNDEHRYVHVTGTLPNFIVWGAIFGREAKQSEWLHDYGGRPAAYFVPREALLPIWIN